MDTANIEAFLTVVRHGSLTKASEELFITQSSLSHRISQLEKEINTKLIERGRGIRSLSLTQNGQEFLPLAKRWESLNKEANKIGKTTRSLKITIGAVDTIHNYILPSVYRLLASENIMIHARTHQSTELYSLLETGEIDVAFAFLEQPMPNMIVEEFYTEPMVIIRKDELPNRQTDVISKDELDSINELYVNWSPSFQAWYDKWKDKDEYPYVQLDTAQLLLNFMKNSMQWAIVPLSMAKGIVSTSNDIFIYKLETPPPDRVCYLIRPKYPSPDIKRGLNILYFCLNQYYKIEGNIPHQ